AQARREAGIGEGVAAVGNEAPGTDVLAGEAAGLQHALDVVIPAARAPERAHAEAVPPLRPYQAARERDPLVADVVPVGVDAAALAGRVAEVHAAEAAAVVRAVVEAAALDRHRPRREHVDLVAGLGGQHHAQAV